MTADTRIRSEPAQHASKSNWRQIIPAFLAVALIVAALGLASLGLGALNDVLVRGLSGIGIPSG